MSTQAVTTELDNSQAIEQMQEKRAENAVHRPNGKFAPGNGAARGYGRPKTALISQALRENLEAGGAEKYAAAVAHIALKGKRQADRLAAVNLIADRTEGKPLQAMLVGHTVDESSVRAIAELLGKMNTPPILEADNE